MFSGIIEACVQVKLVESSDPSLIRICVERPSFFDDIHLGDSIAVNGVCLTVEKMNAEALQFAIAAETIKVTSWSPEFLKSQKVNLERSLRFGDRIHGHLVSGHVEDMGKIIKSEALGESWIVQISYPKTLKKFIWKKVSLCINGISLTVNTVEDGNLEVCLIPETQERTNLSKLPVGSFVCLEPDYFAKALSHWKEIESE